MFDAGGSSRCFLFGGEPDVLFADRKTLRHSGSEFSDNRLRIAAEDGIVGSNHSGVRQKRGSSGA